jgi:hypothetical protein
MPGKYGSPDVTVGFDDGPGPTGQLVAIENFFMEIGGAKIEVRTQDSTAFGDRWNEHVPTGLRGCPAIKMSGLFDTTPDGPHDILQVRDADCDPNGGTRTLAIGFGDGKTFTVETRLIDYEVAAQNAALTEFTATVQPTGAAVWS